MSDTSGFATSAGGLDAGGSVSLFDTIVAGNTGTAVAQDVMGVVTSQGHNLIGNGDGSTGLVDGINNDRVGTTGSAIDAHLGPLQDNGGPTPTMALLSGSPAIDAGDNAGAPPSDQRGFVRVFNTTIDIGAFEAQSPELLATSTVLLLNTASPAEGQPLSFIISVSQALPGASPATPGGTAHVRVDGGAPSDVTVTGGSATFDLPGGLAHGSHTIDAVYDGDGTFAGSSSGTTFTVVAAPPTTTPVGVTVAGPLTGDVTALVTITRVPGPHGKGKPARTLIVTLVNSSGQVIEGPITVVLNGLRPAVKVLGASGFTDRKKHRRPFVVLTPGADNLFQPGGRLSFLLRFHGRPTHFTATVTAGPANP
jgi:Bacterial Ig-like domain (group 3)